jgi:hypothetical protein
MTELDKGFTNTPITGGVAKSIALDPINFGADFRVFKDTSDELWLTNVTSPIDRPERVRYAMKEVKNVYQGTDVSLSAQAASRKGVNLHVQLQQNFATTEVDRVVHLPVTTSITIKVPASANIDAAEVKSSVSRLLSTLFETGSDKPDRLAALLRGSLEPTDI